MKIQKTIVKNFKAISEKEVEFGGCSVIVTGANQEGKTSLLRGLMDRFQGENSKNVVRNGEKNDFRIKTA